MDVYAAVNTILAESKIRFVTKQRDFCCNYFAAEVSFCIVTSVEKHTINVGRTLVVLLTNVLK